MAEVESGNSFPKLSELNYSTWNENMKSRLKRKALWRIITGDKKAPATTVLRNEVFERNMGVDNTQKVDRS